MDKNKALKILKEVSRRQEEQSILKDCFPEQLRFITDKSKKKAALCSRRASKSYSAAIMLIQACLENPNIANAYLGLTKETAKNVLIPHIKKLKRKYKLNCTIYKSPTSVTFPNGSSILFFGLNDSAEEKDKILGQAFKVVVIDECASMTIDLRATIQEFISPTLLDHEGQLVLIGTPQNLRNYFYDITTNKIPGWSVHRWTADKNPFVAKQYNNEIDELRQQFPNIDSDPGFQQHYLGLWTIDTDKQLYKVNESNYITELPPGEYNYILSLDIGWEDDNAFTVGAFKAHDTTLYIVETFSKNKMLLDEIIFKINELEQKYPFYSLVIDNANKQFVQELTYRSGRHFKPATKTDKLDYISLMNSDFACQKIKIIAPKCQNLIKEYSELTVLDQTTKNYQKAIGSQFDHGSDSSLYLWREALNYTAQPEKPKPLPNSEEAIEQFWQQEQDSIASSKSKAFWEV